MKKIPELLCPAGSPEAFAAAIEGGADAVYLGGTLFNARMNAHNFDFATLSDSVRRAHRFGVKVYLTLNTLISDRELPAYLRAAEEAGAAGVDALIVADLGGASAIRRTFPSLELHASTQMSGHGAEFGKRLADLGFSRMVLARETPLSDMISVVRDKPLEVEVFVHGALCVSHSGQCLFSSLVGGRSGNRGECAQPCRLPYACSGCGGKNVNGKREDYPLSLKDLTLSEHVTDLIAAGVSSLKIEGRMKPPEYVRDTAKIWRRLLDEGRNATPAEVRELASIFSRGGFTDGYFEERIDRSMLGIRSDSDKEHSREREPFKGLTRKIPLSLSATVRRGVPSLLSVSDGVKTVSVTGDIPEEARTSPLTPENVRKNLTKFGGTDYTVADFSLSLDDGLMLPVSRLNDLRRSALLAFDPHALPLSEEEKARSSVLPPVSYRAVLPTEKQKVRNTARFYSPSQITPSAKAFFDRIFLPLFSYHGECNGVVLPPVVFDHDRERVRKMLRSAKEAGAVYALVGNLGHLDLVRESGLTPVGDFRLNIWNSETVARLESLGLTDGVILSPELALPQLRDIPGNTETVVYGRIPLMTLERCVLRDSVGCSVCATNRAGLTDRKGVFFPILREFDHRNLVLNSLPTGMTDRSELLTRFRLTACHYLFTVESARDVDAVIDAARSGKALPYPVRRIAQTL